MYSFVCKLYSILFYFPVCVWMNECVWGGGDPSVTNLEMQPVLLRPRAPGIGHNGLQLHCRVTGHSGGSALK